MLKMLRLLHVFEQLPTNARVKGGRNKAKARNGPCISRDDCNDQRQKEIVVARPKLVWPWPNWLAGPACAPER
jgi:hypothetical protein